jgi:acyl carrier protein
MTATRDQIIATATDLVLKELGLPPGAVTPDTDLRTLEGADSVKTLRVISKVEREFDVELEDEDVFGVASVSDLATVIEKLAGVRP